MARDGHRPRRSARDREEERGRVGVAARIWRLGRTGWQPVVGEARIAERRERERRRSACGRSGSRRVRDLLLPGLSQTGLFAVTWFSVVPGSFLHIARGLCVFSTGESRMDFSSSEKDLDPL